MIKTRVNTSQDNVNIVESCGPYFGVDPEKGSQTRRAPMKTKPAKKLVRTTAENQEENSKSVAALFLFMTYLFLFAQLTRSTQLSYTISFSRRLQKKCSSE